MYHCRKTFHFKNGEAVRRIWLPVALLCVLGFIPNFKLFAQAKDTAVTTRHHYRWKLELQKKGIRLNPANTFFYSTVMLEGKVVGTFETKINDWLEFEIDPKDFPNGPILIWGSMFGKENGKRWSIHQGFRKTGIARWPHKQKLQIDLFDMGL